MPNQSLILQAIRYTGDFYQMPPEGKLDEDAIAILSKWIKEGAFWPSDPLPAQNGNKVFSISESDRNFWAFQPITRPVIPAVDKNIVFLILSIISSFPRPMSQALSTRNQHRRPGSPTFLQLDRSTTHGKTITRPSRRSNFNRDRFATPKSTVRRKMGTTLV